MTETSPQESLGLQAEGFRLRIAGRTLLENASFRIEPGELVLLIGPSGTGKSLLLQIVAGVLSPKSAPLALSGRLQVGDANLLGSRRERKSIARDVGLVFQDHALFDDLSPKDNLLFALSHSVQSRSIMEKRRIAIELLEEFGLRGAPHVRALSGGQRQRLAVARTLAQDPRILVYDEPTTGLDPANALRVANRIQQTHRDHHKTSVVVTHDYPSLLHIADRVLLLDPNQHEIREIPKESAAEEMTRIDEKQRQGTTSANEELPSLLQRVSRPLSATTDLFTALVSYVAHLIPTFPRWKWGLHFLHHQIRLVAYPSSLAYMAIAGLILGFVSTYFTLRYLPYARYTEPLLIDEILAGLGYLTFRVLTPVLATILVAARCGAAVASDLGNRTYGRQLDAMRSFGIAPSRYLLTSVAWAFLLGTPILSGLAYLIARWVSEIVFVFTYPDYSAFFWDMNYHKNMLHGGGPLFDGWGWVLAKVEVAGAGIASIAYHLGTRAKRSGTEVSLAVTSTIIWATLWVLMVHFVFAFFEF